MGLTIDPNSGDIGLSTGATGGGGGGLANVVEDTTPQLGGDLDLNTHNISGTGNISASNLSGTNTGDQDLSSYATLTGSETLTNKTLTSPVINTPTGIVKGDVGLGNVDNTSDANKPVSTATQTALDAKVSDTGDSITGEYTITNTGTGNTLKIDANGNVGTTASTSGALQIENTGNTGFGLNVYSNLSTMAAALSFMKLDHASATGQVLRLDNDGTGNALRINANGNVGTTASTSGAVLITNTANTGYGLNVYSDAGASAGALVRIFADNALFDQPALHIKNDGTSGAAASIRLDGVSPQIEFAEDDQATPAGKFEIQVQGDIFYINGRNSGDSSFENIISTERLADGGGIYLHGTTSGTTRILPAATASGALTLPAATDTLVGKATTDTLTNKRITKRTGTTTSSATPTINTDNVDFYSLTAQTVDITSFTTNLSGTPTDGQTLWIAITGTAARAITWGASFEASTVALPTTTVTTNRLDVGFVWNAATSKWRCIASA